jgi:DNA-binding IclR family transcriptional regulator
MAEAETVQYQSPPIMRAAAVLNFLAGHPEQAFTLSEIAKSLKISSATCHNLLSALAEAGYVFRTVGKTYVLGPALANVARAAQAPAVVMQVTRPEMRQLADEFDVVCSVFYFENGESIIRERAASLSHVNWNAPYLLATPAKSLIGRFLMTWDEGVYDAWCKEGDPTPDEDRAARGLASLHFLRDNGYVFGVRKVPLTDPDRARALQNQSTLTDSEIPGLEQNETYQLAYVVAPVFSRAGVVAFGLSLAGFTAPVKGSAIAAMGIKLRAAADRIGSFIAGRDMA